MTVTIIKPGVKHEDRLYHASCRRCQCEFTFNRSDAMLVSDQRDGDYLRLPCPACTTVVTVDANTPSRPSKK